MNWKASCYNTYCSANSLTRVNIPKTDYKSNWLESLSATEKTNWLRIGTIDVNSDLNERVVDSDLDDTQIFMCLESRSSKLKGVKDPRPSGDVTITFSSGSTGKLKTFEIATAGSAAESLEFAIAEKLRYENCHLYEMRQPVKSNQVSITLGYIPQALTDVVYGLTSANENMPPELAASKYITVTNFRENVEKYENNGCADTDCVDLDGKKTDIVTTFVAAYCGKTDRTRGMLPDVARPDLAVTLIEEHPDKDFSKIRTQRPLTGDKSYKRGIVNFDSDEDDLRWAVSKVVVNICHKRIVNPEKSYTDPKCLEYVDQLKDVQHDFVKDAPTIFRITTTQEAGDRVLFLHNPVVREHSDHLSTCKTSTFSVEIKPWEILAAAGNINVEYNNGNTGSRRRSGENLSETSTNPTVFETENSAASGSWGYFLPQWLS